MLKITVKKQYVEFVNRFASTDESRFYLNGLFFDKQENAVVATDGHRLGVIKNAFTHEGEFAESGYIIKFSKQALSLLKSFKHAEEFEVIIDDNNKASLNVWGSQMSLELIDSDYPNWRRICTEETESITKIGLNPKLLKDFQVKEFVRLEFTGDTSPIRVVVPELPEFYGLLMPARV